MPSDPIHLAVLGDPIEHSRSPAIHTAALRMAGLHGDYAAIRADRPRLEAAIEQLRTGELHGLNITMPLKEAALAMVDETTREGEAAGSINTLRYRHGRVQGHSSDVVAFGEILGSESFEAIGDVLVLGSGGSARAALAALGGHNTYLAGRSESKAEVLSGAYENVTVVPWGTGVAGAVVINASPLGMDAEHLPRGVVDVARGLIDLPYGDASTPAVRRALQLGLLVADGFEFLAVQAAESFNWWTGVTVESRVLAEVARNA